jgi:glucosamine--fructose-6-phosphate aminotransferase (isomerizing)
MCGIIAAASTRNVGKLLVQGLHKMEYRGYDSAGIALHQEGSIAHLRTVGKVQLLEDKMIAEKPKSKLGYSTYKMGNSWRALRSQRPPSQI